MTSPESSVSASPARRAWVSTALMIVFFGVMFVPSIFLVNVFVTATDGWAGLGYVVVAMFVYFAAVAVLIPVTAHTLGRYLDSRTRDLPHVKAAGVFALFAALIGSMLGVPLWLEGATGVLPLIAYMLIPAVAAFATRMVLPVALRVAPVRVTAYVLAGAAVAGLGALAVWNVLSNSA